MRRRAARIRCVLLRLTPGADASALTTGLTLHAAPLGENLSAIPAKIAEPAEAAMIAGEGRRLEAIDALRSVVSRDGYAAPLRDLLSAMEAPGSEAADANNNSMAGLVHTLRTEALLGCEVRAII